MSMATAAMYYNVGGRNGQLPQFNTSGPKDDDPKQQDALTLGGKLNLSLHKGQIGDNDIVSFKPLHLTDKNLKNSEFEPMSFGGLGVIDDKSSNGSTIIKTDDYHRDTKENEFSYLKKSNGIKELDEE
mmetsp:Transcript_19480/g.22677  ORF Transcript_19480/g.22677 Transcript_19480/m.22677 type:complete len:128 (-) Transcript_19480:70-453(-)